MNAPSWLGFLVGLLVVLAILWLLGVNVNAG